MKLLITPSDDFNHSSSSYYSSPFNATTIIMKLNFTSMLEVKSVGETVTAAVWAYSS